MWHHEHFVYKIEGGVIMKDIVSYKPPFGFIGSIANSLIIEKKLTEIFNHRFQSIEKLFGVYAE
jgi:ligand-binding SRPBCC domain-containing protein